MRSWLIDILIRALLGALDYPKETLSKEIEDGLLAQMWESSAFRKRVADRDAKIIHTMAGGEGLAPEPRDSYAMHAGQRVENLLWARDAKAAWQRIAAQRQKNIDALKKEQDET